MKWWNVVVEITVPFDTEAEAEEYRTRSDWVDSLFGLFGDNTVIGGHIEEADDSRWPWSEEQLPA